jgi:peptidyl-prolyl cis-trans isomerase D
MFEWVRNNKRLMQVLLALIALPFAFFGVESYQALNAVTEVASIDGEQKITEQEFSNAMRQQQDRMRGILGRGFDPAMLDSPEMRTELLDGLIAQRLLTREAVRSKLNVSDEQLREVIIATPAFQVEGKFSASQYETLLRAQNLTPTTFETSLRHDLMMQQLASALSEASFASKSSAATLASARVQQREVAESMVRAAQFTQQVKPSAEAIEAFYKENLSRFRTPEQLRVEYVVLNAEAVTAVEVVPDADVRKVYEDNPSRYGQLEQRQASHILIAFKAGVDKAKALEKARQLTEQIRKAPASFAELAKKHSDDPGSGAKGGDLGVFGRGMMVKSFEEAVFALKQGELSEPVESEFGYHIIRLTGIRPAKMKPFEQVRGEIEAELRKQRGGRKFAEAADAFSNLVYEQADSLKPAAERFKLAIRQSGWTTRETSPDEVLRNPKLLAGLFSEDVVKNRRNTEAIEVAPGTLVSARVAEHKPAAQKTLEEVRSQVVAMLVEKEARALAIKEGKARLAALQKGDGNATFAAARMVSRDKLEGLRREAVDPVFKAGVDKLPAYVGVELPDGYAVYRIGKVVTPAVADDQLKAIHTELGRMTGAQEFRAYIAALRANGKVKVNDEILQKKQQP